MVKGGSQYEVDGKTHYERNKAKYKQKSLLQREAIRSHILVIKRNGKCVDCGNPDWRVLEFDHVRGVKEFTIGTAATYGYSLKRIDDEIAKCELRCANCHRIRTLG